MADLVFIPEPSLMEKVPADNRFSSKGLVEALRQRGINAFYGENTGHLIDLILSNTGKGDVILIMSNVALDNIHDRLLKKI